MNKFKKIGLTALAGSLVATSAFAGELEILECADNCLELGWSHEGNTAQLSIDLQKSVADITIIENGEIARYHIADTLRAVTQ